VILLQGLGLMGPPAVPPVPEPPSRLQ
jgi:hypothetical protein